MSNPYAPPTVNESKTGNRFLWRIPGFVFMTLGLMMPVIATMLFGGLPIGLGGITGLLILFAGILMVTFSLPRQTDSEKRRKRWLLWLIPVLAILIASFLRLTIQPIHHRACDQICRVLLNEMIRFRHGDKCQVFIDPLPCIIQGTWQQSFVLQSMKHQH